MDEQALGVRTLARRIADQSGGEVESWRSQIYRIRDNGQQPDRPTAVKIARALGKPDGYLVGETGDQRFSTALLGQVVMLLEQEPALARMHPGLLEGLAAELRAVAERLEAVAAAGRGVDELPDPHA